MDDPINKIKNGQLSAWKTSEQEAALALFFYNGNSLLGASPNKFSNLRLGLVMMLWTCKILSFTTFNDI